MISQDPQTLSSDLLEYLEQFLTDQRKARFEEILSQRTRYLTVVLEDLYQPHNASAVMRSCDCFGIQDVYWIEKLWQQEINHQIALGAEQWLTPYLFRDEENPTLTCFDTLKSRGYQILALTPDSHAKSLYEIELNQRTALVFGSEKSGLSEVAIEEADQCVTIPMHGLTDSLNLSVSVAISLSVLTEHMRKSIRYWRLSDSEQKELYAEWVWKSVSHRDALLKRFQQQSH